MKRTFVSTLAVALSSLSLGACLSVRASERGEQFYNAGNYLFAADAFTEDIREHPRSATAWNNRAVTRVRLGDLTGAIRDYNRAIELAPDDPELHFNRANALVSAGLYEEAIVDYDRAIQLNPFYARAIFNRGSASALAGKPDQARRDWQAAIGLEPDPYAKSAMRRSSGLEEAPPVAAAFPPPTGQPTTAYTIAPPPPPGTAPGAVPLPAGPSPSALARAGAAQPAASPQAVDSRALTTRAISRELDGDHAGALQDLNAALAIEPDTARREAIARMLRLLDTPR